MGIIHIQSISSEQACSGLFTARFNDMASFIAWNVCSFFFKLQIQIFSIDMVSGKYTFPQSGYKFSIGFRSGLQGRQSKTSTFCYFKNLIAYLFSWKFLSSMKIGVSYSEIWCIGVWTLNMLLNIVQLTLVSRLTISVVASQKTSPIPLGYSHQTWLLPSCRFYPIFRRQFFLQLLPTIFKPIKITFIRERNTFCHWSSVHNTCYWTIPNRNFFLLIWNLIFWLN